MSPAPKFSDEELILLKEFLPQYESCRPSRKYTSFWESVFAAYVARFKPLEKNYPGRTDVMDLSVDEQSDYSKALGKLKNRIKEWYRWQCNPRSRSYGASITSKDLKNIYQERKRSAKPYEVFAKLFPEQVESVHTSTCYAEGITGKQKLRVWHRVCANLWQSATEEQREAVFEKIQKDAEADSDEGEGGEDESPESYDRLYTRLPSILQTVVEPLVTKAGVMAFVTIVAPCPSADGRIVASSYQFDTGEETPHFAKTWPHGYQQFAESLCQFAGKHLFPEDVCARRSLTNAGKGGTDKPEESASSCRGLLSSGSDQDRPASETSPEVNQGDRPASETSPASNPELNQAPSVPPAEHTTGPSKEAHAGSSQEAPKNRSNTTTSPLHPSTAISTPQSASPVDNTSVPPPPTGTLPSASLPPPPSTDPVPPVPPTILAHDTQLASGGGQPYMLQGPSNGLYLPDDGFTLRQGMYRRPLTPDVRLLTCFLVNQTWEEMLAANPELAKVDLSAYMDPSPSNPVWADLGILEKMANDEDEDLFGNSGTLDNRPTPTSRLSSLLNSTDLFGTNSVPTGLDWGDCNLYPSGPPPFGYGLTPEEIQAKTKRVWPEAATGVADPAHLPPSNQSSLSHQHQALPAVSPQQNTVPAVPQPIQDTVYVPTLALEPIQNTVPRPESTQNTVPVPQPIQTTIPPIQTVIPIAPPNATQTPTPPHQLQHQAPAPQPPPVLPLPPLPPQPPHQFQSPVPQPHPSHQQQAHPPIPPSNANQTPSSPHQHQVPVPQPQPQTPVPVSSPNSEQIPSPPLEPLPNHDKIPSPPSLPPHQDKVPSPPPIPPSNTNENPLPPIRGDEVPPPPSALEHAGLDGDLPSSRRSTRPKAKSTRNEQANQIGSNPLPPRRVDMSQVDTTAPSWFAEAMRHLASRPMGDDWSSAILGWAELERALGYGKVSKGSPAVAKRPEEWTKFAAKTSRGVRPYETGVPFITDPAEFGTAVTTWWISIQPPFRVSETGNLIPVYKPLDPVGDIWVGVRKSGPNGLVSVMTLLAWWGRGALGASEWVEESLPAWRAIVVDVTRCMEAILSSIPAAKRPSEGGEVVPAPPNKKP